MLKIIVNADDLGAAEANNQAIFDLMKLGRVTSSTVMVNGRAFESAVKRMPEFPQCSFGVHLDLNEFDFITRDRIFVRYGVTDEAGHVVGNIRHKFLWPSRALLDAVYREWAAQLRKALDAGVPVSHIDSHRHAHTLRIFAPVLLRLGQEFHIGKMRNKCQDFRYCGDRPLLHRLHRDFKRRLWCSRMRRHFVTPDHFDEAIPGMAYMACHRIERDLVIEWMCHPGNPLFPEDAPALAGDWAKKILTPFQLIGYNDL